MTTPLKHLRYVQEASKKDAILLIDILAASGIASALCGTNAANYFGSGLCPIDIEVVVNAVDQEHVFKCLTTQGAQLAVPDEKHDQRATTLAQWHKVAPLYRYRNRCRTRICTPIYELPKTGDHFTDAMHPFIIVYSAETLALHHVPSIQHSELTKPSNDASHSSYILTSALVASHESSSRLSNNSGCLIPSFTALVNAEMHTLLRHANFLSPVWGQHIAQLGALLHSGYSHKDIDQLPSLVDPKLRDFAHWMQLSWMNKTDVSQLESLRDSYNEQDKTHSIS